MCLMPVFCVIIILMQIQNADLDSLLISIHQIQLLYSGSHSLVFSICTVTSRPSSNNSNITQVSATAQYW
jgi:hypothetical protein